MLSHSMPRLADSGEEKKNAHPQLLFLSETINHHIQTHHPLSLSLSPPASVSSLHTAPNGRCLGDWSAGRLTCWEHRHTSYVITLQCSVDLYLYCCMWVIFGDTQSKKTNLCTHAKCAFMYWVLDFSLPSHLAPTAACRSPLVATNLATFSTHWSAEHSISGLKKKRKAEKTQLCSTK